MYMYMYIVVPRAWSAQHHKVGAILQWQKRTETTGWVIVVTLHFIRIENSRKASDRGVQIMLEKVADSARKAVKLAEPYKPYGGQFLEFCSISLSTYQNA